MKLKRLLKKKRVQNAGEKRVMKIRQAKDGFKKRGLAWANFVEHKNQVSDNAIYLSDEQISHLRAQSTK